MGHRLAPQPVMPFTGVLSPDLSVFRAFEEAAASRLGPIVLETEPYPWNYSRYYEEEMGAGLLRKFIFFRRLIDPALLRELKAWSNNLENLFGMQAGEQRLRRINIDPGYLDRAKVVLASTKDPGHRIYLGGGIYAETSLLYFAGSHQPYGYTYPDLKSPEAITMFDKARTLYLEILRESG